jgi:peptide/nickel transport system ATP-binding protein
VLLITHDLGLAAERAERIIVMKDGEIVEAGRAGSSWRTRSTRIRSAGRRRPSIASQRIQAVVEDRGVKTASDIADATPTLRVRELTKDYKIRQGSFRSEPFRAVDAVSFDIPRGKTSPSSASRARASRPSPRWC